MSPSRGWRLFLLGAAIILVVFFVGFPAYQLFAEQSDDVAQAQVELARYRAEIAAEPRLKHTLSALDADATTQAALLGGAGAALASADLQGLVKALAERHGGQMRSAQTVATATEGGLEKISVQFELTLPLGALAGATYDLESGTPYLYLDAVDIKPELYSGAGAQAPATVHVSWTVHGYRKRETR